MCWNEKWKLLWVITHLKMCVHVSIQDYICAFNVPSILVPTVYKEGKKSTQEYCIYTIIFFFHLLYVIVKRSAFKSFWWKYLGAFLWYTEHDQHKTDCSKTSLSVVKPSYTSVALPCFSQALTHHQKSNKIWSQENVHGLLLGCLWWAGPWPIWKAHSLYCVHWLLKVMSVMFL